MSHQHLRFDVADGVGHVTFTRPEKLNALTYETYGELEALTREMPRRDDVRVLVLRGEGKAFCAGGDVHSIIGDMFAKDMREHLEFTRMTGDVGRNLRETPQPVIAQVRGVGG